MCGVMKFVCLYCQLMIALLLVFYVSCAGTTSNSTLTFVFAVSRHGHRSPLFSIYPPEEAQENFAKYFPEGLGQLTKRGKQLMYKVGEALQKRYADFLGHEYEDSKVYFTATESPRAMMSAMLVASAMFPPQGFQVWKEDLKWQPIPVFTDTKDFDKHYILHQKADCPGLHEKVMERKRTLLAPDHSPQNQQLFQFLSNKLGANVTSTGMVSGIHDFLGCQKEAGAPLPEWAAEVFPNKTLPYQMKFYEVYSDDDDMQKVFAEPMLQEIKSKLKAKTDGVLNTKRLFHFHSSHDLIVRPLLVGLGFNITDPIHSGATVLIELHRIENDFKVKIVYLKPQESLMEFSEMLINECGLYCELDKFIQMIPSIAPSDWQLNC